MCEAEQSSEDRYGEATALIENASREMSEIHRGKHYGLWRQDAEPALDAALSEVEPFRAYADIWLCTGDGGGMVLQKRFGGWVIDRLVAHNTPPEILEMFNAEVVRNIGRYTELTPLFGVSIDAICDLGNGITIEPPAEDILAQALRYWPFQRVEMPTGTAMLCQSYTVTPAFVPNSERSLHENSTVTAPPYAARDATRRRVRLACLLAGAGAVELPITAVQPIGIPASCRARSAHRADPSRRILWCRSRPRRRRCPRCFGSWGPFRRPTVWRGRLIGWGARASRCRTSTRRSNWAWPRKSR